MFWLGSSPRPGLEGTPQLPEDLQHDIAIIGEIAGKVASLRRSYKVQKLYYIEVPIKLIHEDNMWKIFFIDNFNMSNLNFFINGKSFFRKISIVELSSSSYNIEKKFSPK